MNKQRRWIRRSAAFTLLEVLMVVAIIGLLAAFVVPNLFTAREGARIDLTQALITSGLNGALDRYRLDMGQYPGDDEDGLMALIEPPRDPELAKRWRGPYLKSPKDLKDAWGNDLMYRFPGRYNEDGYDLSSAGPDGREGTDNDITNWERD